MTVTPVDNASNPTVTPNGATADELKNLFQQTAQVIQGVMDGFEAPPANPQPQPKQEEPANADHKKAGEYLKSFMNYIQGDKFRNDVNMTAKKYNVPPKALAENFFTKCLGTIGDVLGIAIGTVGNAAHTLVNVLSAIAHGAVDVVVSVAHALARVVTLNKTCIA